LFLHAAGLGFESLVAHFSTASQADLGDFLAEVIGGFLPVFMM